MSPPHASPTPAPQPTHPTPTAVWLYAASILCLLAAAGVAATLALGERALPGCGEGGGCGEVLASRWAWVGPVPVSVIGLAAYLAAAGVVGGLLVSAIRAKMPNPWAVRGYYLVMAVIVMGAVWFIYVQAVLIGAFCMYCTAAHALGVVGAVLPAWGLQSQLRLGGDPGSEAQNPVAKDMRLQEWKTDAFLPRLLGIACVTVLAGLQYLLTPPPTTIDVDEDATSHIESPTADPAIEPRPVTLGNLTLDLADPALPVLGPRDARQVVGIFFDHGCPHCRHAHHLLDEIRGDLGDDLAVVLLPVPIHPDCNPAFSSEQGWRFADSCERSRIMLALAAVAPDQLAEWDRWMFEPEDGLGFPRSGAEAFRHAAELVGDPEELREAMDSDAVTRRLEESVAAWQALDVGKIPVLLAPGHDALLPRNGGDADEIAAWLAGEAE